MTLAMLSLLCFGGLGGWARDKTEEAMVGVMNSKSSSKQQEAEQVEGKTNAAVSRG